MSIPPPIPQNPWQQAGRGGGPDAMFDPGAGEFERNYSMALHLSVLAMHFALPLVPAIVLYMIKKDESSFIRDHGKEAINFQITLLLYAALAFVTFPLCFVGIVIGTAAYVLGIVGMILATVAAKSGRYYRYPACIRVL